LLLQNRMRIEKTSSRSDWAQGAPVQGGEKKRKKGVGPRPRVFREQGGLTGEGKKGNGKEGFEGRNKKRGRKR